MITRLEIALKPEFTDPRGTMVRQRAARYLSLDLEDVRTRDVYKIKADLSAAETQKVLHELIDPVSQLGAKDRLTEGASDYDSIVHVGYKPGVTDPIGKSARVAVQDTIGRDLNPEDQVFTSRLYLLKGVQKDQAQSLAKSLLANPLIETIEVSDVQSWLNHPVDLSVPEVTMTHTAEAKRMNLEVTDEELEKISKEGLLALTLKEMQVIRDHFIAEGQTEARTTLGLDTRPTDVELECLAQTWSEHCKHKIFNASVRYIDENGEESHIPSLFKSYIRGTTTAVREAWKANGKEDWLVSVFHDNAGVITFDDQIHLVFKVETHNSPSALDPYGGAITGIVGVNRDPFGTGLGSHLLSNVWGYCFGDPRWAEPMPAGLLHPRRIRDGVHEGVIDGGNQSGVPYGRGWELFDARYLGKPLVFCGTVGALPTTIAGGPGEEKGARPGDRIVMAGGRIGADGIHGATFSSEALDESAPVQAVQIGDPITQKLLFDFLLEARELGYYSAITDNGAGGLSSSVGEMAEASGGAQLDLAKAPLKYSGLAPWEILVSEAQERMTLAIPPEHLDAFLALAKKRHVEAVDLGQFTDDGRFHVFYGDQTVAYLSMEFLHEGDPDLDLVARWNPPQFESPSVEALERIDLPHATYSMLKRLNLSSNESKARHYDHEVKALSVIRPWVGVDQDVASDAAVFMARHGSTKGYALSEGVHPFLSDLDTYDMAEWTVDLAVRRQIVTGARPDRIALLDNFCWPDPVQSTKTPNGEYKMAQLVRACQGLKAAATSFNAPLISGKDSMKNDSTMGGVKISIPPTLLVSAIGIVDDVRQTITLDPKMEGERVFLLGAFEDAMGGSEFYRWLGEYEGQHALPGGPAPYVGDRTPTLSLETLPAMYNTFHEAVLAGEVRSATAPGLGGLGVAIAKMAIAGQCGFELDVSAISPHANVSTSVKWFGEAGGRILATVAPSQVDNFKARFTDHCLDLGHVTANHFKIKDGDRSFELDIKTLRSSYKETLSNA